MARFYSDENFPLPVVEALQQLGHDVLTIFAAGKGNQRCPDETVLLDAVANERIVLTVNRKDFKRLHNEGIHHHGIILCTYDPDFIGQAHRIDAAIQSYDSLQGLLLRVNRPG